MHLQIFLCNYCSHLENSGYFEFSEIRFRFLDLKNLGIMLRCLSANKGTNNVNFRVAGRHLDGHLETGAVLNFQVPHLEPISRVIA